ncbi:MAG: two pore domain potassium channel family protein [Phycisphaerae bacterium]|nr:two pore domain potassium channel family protein [Phycisphaerae bacterium]
MLVSLGVLLVLYPYVEEGHEATTLMSLMFSLVPLAGVYAVSDKRWHIIVAIILAVPFLGYHWFGGILTQTNRPIWLYSGPLAFYTFTTITIFSHVLRGTSISDDKLYGAVSVYVLIGLTFMTAYSLLEHVEPGSFFIDHERDPDRVLSHTDMLYFSFATLTTVGYGDMTPVTSKARSLAMLEAILGPLFIAILIARLVGSARAGGAATRSGDG